MQQRKVNYSRAKIIQLVEDLRKKIAKEWPTPDIFCSYLFAVSEIGEFADSVVSGLEEWVRNNPDRKKDPIDKEFAQFMIMLATALIANGIENFGSYQFIMSSHITYIISGKRLTSWRTQIEDMLDRAIEVSEQFGLDAVQIVEKECDRILIKYSGSNVTGTDLPSNSGNSNSA